MMITKIGKHFHAIFPAHIDIEKQKIDLMSGYDLYAGISIRGHHDILAQLFDNT